MSSALHWVATSGTIAVLVVYELALALLGHRNEQRIAMTAHAALRAQWLDAVSAQPGSEILGVQTLRNALMSAIMTASTAALGLMGAVTLASPSLVAGFAEGSTTAPLQFTPRLMIELSLLVLLFAALLCAAMAVRYYNHASFIVGMPVGSVQRKQWTATGGVYLRRAGLLFSRALRYLILVAPMLVCLLYPAAGPIAALLVVAVLYRFDRVGTH
ncbi:MAG: DUF599 domain-containing protein [Burkholderiaceae bacterium]